MAARTESVEFLGYPRPNGKVGVRNHLAIIPSVFCANLVAEKIAAQVQGAVAMPHPLGCSQVGEDLEITARTLKALGRHPNVAAVLVVGLGCERLQPGEVAQAIASSGRPVETIVIQDEGGSLKAIERGSAIARTMASDVFQQRSESVPVSELVVALKCGGTDATSGLAANPAVGVAADQVVRLGGSTILSEVTELLGTEHILAQRAVSPEVAERVYAVIAKMEAKLGEKTSDDKFRHRGALISTGNFDGGVSTVVEKALGGVRKGGTAPLSGVLEYAEELKGKGLFLMDSPGHDAEVVTGMVAAGAQIVLFTSGRGTPTGFPIAPVIKITGNSETYRRMIDNIDINAGPVIEGRATLAEVGNEIFREIIAVASGKRTKAELLGHHELFAITRV